MVKDIWIEANPKETDLTPSAPGNAAVVTVDSYPGVESGAARSKHQPATGAEFFADPAQTPGNSGEGGSGSVRVRPRLSPACAGMSAAVEIDTYCTRGFNVQAVNR